MKTGLCSGSLDGSRDEQLSTRLAAAELSWLFAQNNTASPVVCVATSCHLATPGNYNVKNCFHAVKRPGIDVLMFSVSRSIGGKMAANGGSVSAAACLLCVHVTQWCLLRRRHIREAQFIFNDSLFFFSFPSNSIT